MDDFAALRESFIDELRLRADRLESFDVTLTLAAKYCGHLRVRLTDAERADLLAVYKAVRAAHNAGPDATTL